MSPKTFTAFGAAGVVFGALSQSSMERIFTNIDNCLGGNKNTNLKVSLIVAYILFGKNLPLPSIPKVMAAFAGCLLGLKGGTLIPKPYVKMAAQGVDIVFGRFLPALPSKPAADTKQQ